MERFTNEYSRFLEEVKQELVEYTSASDERIVAHYREMPWLSGDWFSFIIVQSMDQRSFRIVHRYWDRQYDLRRAPLGIFNLERICLREQEICVNGERYPELYHLIESVDQMPSSASITIDGIDCILFIHNTSQQDQYWWNTGPDKVDSFAPLIAYLKTLFSFHY